MMFCKDCNIKPKVLELQAENAKLRAVVDVAYELAQPPLRDEPFTDMLKVLVRLMDALQKLKGDDIDE